MPSKQHKALFLESRKGRFILGDNETPKPGQGEVLVRVESAALNPVDWGVQAFGIIAEEFPTILGVDAAGIVEEVGEGVSRFVKGDRIFYACNLSVTKGGFQQYNLVQADHAAKIPDSISFDQAASIPVTFATAFISMFNDKPYGAGLPLPLEPEARGQQAGQPFVVLGGATSVGQYAIQLGRLSGFSPIITTASLKHEGYLKSIGATHIVDRNLTSSLAEEVLKITKNPVKLVHDTIMTPETQNVAYDLLAPGGDMLTVATGPDSCAVKSPSSNKPIYYVFASFYLPHNRELGHKLYNKFTDLLADGSIQPNRVEVVPGGLNGIKAGLERMKANGVSGVKLIVHPQETI